MLAEHPKSGLEGVALHLPLAHGAHLSEVHRLINDVVAAELPIDTVWVSHLSAAELATLRAAYPDFTFRPRIGTDLWLGDRGALRVTATVLDVHAVERGDAFGYRHRTAPKAGHILVVSGGTAHGIGLEAPTGDASLRGPGRDPRPRRPGRGRLRAVAVLDRRQAAALRRAAAHAGLDAVPAARRAGARGRRRGRRPGALHRDGVRPRRRRRRPCAHGTGSCRGYQMSRTTTATRYSSAAMRISVAAQ